MSQELRSVRRALISVFDKQGIEEFVTNLSGMGIEIISTGGTKGHLQEAGINVIDVSALTGFPEMMDGRVKTLHPAIHGALLAKRDSASHQQALAEHAISMIDLVCVNLYPFERVAAENANFADTLEMIDIGGPALLRAGAKNHQDVAVICDPADYTAMIDEMIRCRSATSLHTRRRLAQKAFSRTAEYDRAVAEWLGKQV